MITIDVENCLIFVRGIHSMVNIEKAFLKQTGHKRWNWKRYTIVGLADDNSTGLQSALPYSPVEPTAEIGFRYTQKDEVRSRANFKRSGKRKRK